MSARSNQPFNIFLDPAEIQSLDSMEGVPVYDPSAVEPLPGELLLSTSWQKRLHRGFNWVGTMAPGVVLADWVGKTLLGFERSPLSPVLMAVVLGLLVRNLAGLPHAYEQGLRICLRLVLRIGVALLGLKLSITTVGMIGPQRPAHCHRLYRGGDLRRLLAEPHG